MKKLICFFVGLLLSTTVYPQKPKTSQPISKIPLSHDVYDNWKEITYRALTPDGAFAVYTINPQDGDGKVVFHSLKTNTQDSVKRASDIAITWDGRYAVFKIKPQKNLVKELRRQKKKKDDLPKDSLGLFSFSSRKTEKIPDVKSFKVPQKAGGWLAYQLEAPKENKPATTPKPDTVRKNTKSKKVKKNTDDNGYTLVLRSLNTDTETRFGFVKDYAFAKYGQGLLFHSTGNDSTLKPGVYWYDLQTSQLNQLLETKSKYKVKGLSISDDGTQSAFLVDTDTTKALIRYHKLYHWKKGNPSATLLADEKTAGVPGDWMVNENYTPQFSKDGSKLFLGVSPKPVVQDTTLLSEEIVNVEVWTWKDDYIYPMQNRRLEEDKRRSYASVIHLGNPNRVVQLAHEKMPSIETGDEGNAGIALAQNETPYLVMRTWDTNVYKDLTLINLTDGTPQLIQQKVKGNARLSPKANYVVWFSSPDTAWFSYSVAGKKTVKLTENLKVKFADEEDDHPDYPSSYGLAGFTANDASLLVYDRYDIWLFDPENKKAPVNLTKTGRQEKTRYRYLRLDPEERFIDPEKELYLSAFNETTKQSGFYKLSLKDGKLTKLIMGDYRFGNLIKAREANTFAFTRESFREFPDVWTDATFASPRKLSNANPQMSRYLWGTVERVQWTSADNIPLEGLLYKPEGFDPKKKYPMMVYFYEKYADDIHQHYAPAPIRSFINFSLYASNGYVVFVPDVVYKVGYPGESALNCIMPGVTALIAKGFVDEKRIGIQGHSWGGYQIAHMITRTNLFRAAEAGAPVANMISAYGGVRWESGLSRMFQYEKSQSRIGGTLWEKPMLYIENSPIFFADKVQTPVLMMHNDADGAVPWYQGIEFYMALRRLNKPVWMLNYNGQGHGLTQREHRTDFAKRMMQYFDHYLKDAPMPEWMKRGVPAVEKGVKQGIE